MARPLQPSFTFRSWGGVRRGAGRPPTPGRRRVPHRARPPHQRHCPVHVTLRAAAGVPSLRGARVFGALRGALGASSAAGFRVLHFSAQQDHVHLVVEADAPARFVRGVQGLMIRVAKAVNRGVRSPRPRVGRPLSRAAGRVAPRGPGRARVRFAEFREARPRRPRDRSVLVRGVVRRLADAPTAGPWPRAGPGSTDLVGAGGLAPVRPAAGRRGPPGRTRCGRSLTEGRSAGSRSDVPPGTRKSPCSSLRRWPSSSQP